MLCMLFGICTTFVGVPLVHDGDTLYVQGQSIRLHGVDAEELDEPNGPRARSILKSIVNKQTITCSPVGERSHKRVVARCYLRDGQEINRLIIQRGGALDCKHYSGGEYRDDEPLSSRLTLIQKPYC